MNFKLIDRVKTRPQIPAWCRNLRLRPPKPALGNGRLQRQVRRAFLVHGGPLSASEILEWTYARKRMLGERIGDGHRWSVRRALISIGAVKVGRAATIGKADHLAAETG
jgi:hypothetical protein